MSISRAPSGLHADSGRFRHANCRFLEYFAFAGTLFLGGCFFGPETPVTTVSSEGVLEGTFPEVTRADADGLAVFADPSGVLTFLAPSDWIRSVQEDTVAKLVELTASPSLGDFTSDEDVGAVPGAHVVALRGAPSDEGFVSDAAQLAAGLRLPPSCESLIPPPPIYEGAHVASYGAPGGCAGAGTAIFLGAAGWDGDETAIFLTAAVVVDGEDGGLSRQIFESIAIGATSIVGESLP